MEIKGVKMNELEELQTIKKNLIFKSETKEKKDFLFSLYISTREDELSVTSMSEREKKLFLQQQFEAKEKDYSSKFQKANFLIIKRKKKDIGRLVYSVNDKVHLIDIAFIKKARSQGFGREVIDALITYAKEKNKNFELSVAIDNTQALKLYKNLGLRVVGQNGYYLDMQI